MNCLTCKHWNRLFENPDIGTCEAVDVPLVEAYRFQFEECTRFEQGNERQPYYVQGKGFLVTQSLEPNHQRIKKYYSIPFGVIPQPKKKQPAPPRYAVKDDQLEQVIEWRREKKSRFWIAQKLGVSPKAIEGAERRYAEKGAK